MSIGRVRLFMLNTAARLGASREQLARFKGDESGALIIFGLFLVILMLMIGGVAVDTMRYERIRTDLQQTLDRSVLAAANLNQTLDGEDVVRDFMDKAGLGEYLTYVSASGIGSGESGAPPEQPTDNYRSIEARAKVVMPTFLMHLAGVETLPAVAASEARQEVTDVEIIMVLDVSGSMTESDGHGSTKIEALKEAAKKFIDTMLEGDGVEHVTIGIVPYNGQVNLGPKLISRYSVIDNAIVNGLPQGTTDIHCLELPSSGTFYSTRGISRILPLHRKTYTDSKNGVWTGSETNKSVLTDLTQRDAIRASDGQFLSDDQGGENMYRQCGPSLVNLDGTARLDEDGDPYLRDGQPIPNSVSYVRMPTNDAEDLKDRIDDLYAAGNTSITLGMKWGLALIDPSARPIYDWFITAGDIPAAFSGRPYDYDEVQSMKIIVLMTDGKHVKHERVNDAYKVGLSPIYLAEDGKYSIAFRRTGNVSVQAIGTNGAAVSVSRTLVTNTATNPTPHTVLPAADSNGYVYWWPHATGGTDKWDDNSNPAATDEIWHAWQSTPYDNDSADVDDPVQLKWEEVWSRQRVAWVSWQLYARALGGTSGSNRVSRNTQFQNFFRSDWASAATMDTTLDQSCDLAKEKVNADDFPVQIFGIAFKAPAEGQAVISSCATKPTAPYYFPVDGDLTIEDAFNEIASTINYLRLTQ